MIGIFGFFFAIGLVAALSVGVSFFLSTAAPKVAWRKRAILSALVASFIPMSLPIVVLLLGAGLSTEGLVAIISLVIGGVITAALVGYPVAYFYTKRREPPVDVDVFK